METAKAFKAFTNTTKTGTEIKVSTKTKNTGDKRSTKILNTCTLLITGFTIGFIVSNHFVVIIDFINNCFK